MYNQCVGISRVMGECSLCNRANTALSTDYCCASSYATYYTVSAQSHVDGLPWSLRIWHIVGVALSRALVGVVRGCVRTKINCSSLRAKRTSSSPGCKAKRGNLKKLLCERLPRRASTLRQAQCIASSANGSQ